MMKRIGHCSRCGRCCNINNFPEGTTSIGSVREDGTCVYLQVENNNFCLKEVTVKGKPLTCRMFPMGASDIASIPECTYSFVETASKPAPEASR